MESKELIDLYTDYLIVQNHQATATGCSDLVNNLISHDSITRLLSKGTYDSQYLWNSSKSLIRSHENDEGILSLDNSILHKTHSQENEVINWHYDHGKSMAVKGINLLSAIVDYGLVSLPVAYDVVSKDQIAIKLDNKGKERMVRKSRCGLNEMARKLITQVITNHVKFKYITGDRWFSSKENMRFFAQNKLKFVLGIASNRLVALNRQSLLRGDYVNIRNLELNDGESRKVYLKDVPFCVVITRKVFKSGDTITGEIYLVTNDLALSGDHMHAIYQKRWKIEEYHRSIKQNTSICKSPTKIHQTQLNHLCLALLAYSALEKLKVATAKNHYALKRQMLITANQASFLELQKIKKQRLIDG